MMLRLTTDMGLPLVRFPASARSIASLLGLGESWARCPLGAHPLSEREALFLVPVLSRCQLNHRMERYLEMGAFVLRLPHEVAV